MERKHGKGDMKYANGDLYNGMQSNDTRTGQDMYSSYNSDHYQLLGQWKDGEIYWW